jgi:murein DD-endopeptidase MepM/ murein hydrolase activator NlpD
LRLSFDTSKNASALLAFVVLLLTSGVAFSGASATGRKDASGFSPRLPLVESGFTSRPPTPFTWPVTGGISSEFGPGHPLGIDISLRGAPEAPIRAAGSGRVIHAGGNPCCGYGLYVIIDHGFGLTSRYGHLARIDVAEEASVAQGEVLGLGGNTGYSTLPHLHFEVRQDNTPIDPMGLLPASCKDVPGARYVQTAVAGARCPDAIGPDR